jgi:excisionase family DNA binding protein
VTPPTTRPPPPAATGEAISLRQAAQRLGLHYMTVYRYVRTGRLPAHRDGQDWLIDPGDLSLLREQRPPPPGRPARSDRVPIAIARMTAGDEAGVWRVIDDALASGMDVTGVYLDLLVPALRGVGEAWAAGTVTVAAEHRASAVALRIIGRLGPRFARRGRKRGTVVMGAPAGEQHSLPGAIISDLLRGQGFEVVDLGANTPADSFAETAEQASRLVAVVIGATTPGLDDSVRSAVATLAGAAVTAPVLVGGSAVTGAGHARQLGAGAWTGPDGRAVMTTLDRVAHPQ